MSADTLTLYINEDNLVQLDLTKLVTAGTYVNSGTVTWELKDEANTSLFNGNLTYITSSAGKWQAVLDKLVTRDLVEHTRYFLEITIANNLGADGFRRIPAYAEYHGVE